MRNPRLASVYAKSLLDLAQSQQATDAVYADVTYIQQVIKASRDFAMLLDSPIIKADKKLSILEAILKQNISPLTWAFLTLLVKKVRERYLSQITESFIDQYNQLKGIQVVSLTTAVAISDATKQLIIDKVKTEEKFVTIELKTEVDPNIIGGFVLEFNNNLVDASIAHKLNLLKRDFQDNSYISNLR